MSSVKKRSKNPDGDNRSYRRNWTDEEVDKVLDYLRDVIRNDKEIEKPNARAFYGEMLKEIPLPNCNSISVINKMRSVKKSYDEAVKWLENVGQEMQDETAVRDYVLNLCKNFDVLDEIFTNGMASNISFKGDTLALDVVTTETDPSAVVGLQCGNYEITIETENGDSKPQLSPRLSSSVSSATATSTTMALTTSTTTGQSCWSEKGKRKKSPSEYDVPIVASKRQEIQMSECDVQRVKMEQKRLELEREFKERQLSLEERKLELEQEFKREELQFLKEKYNRDKEVELEKFKIEQDVKLQIELAKINSKNGSCY